MSDLPIRLTTEQIQIRSKKTINRIGNGNFDVDISGWSPYVTGSSSSELSYSTSAPYSGVGCLLATITKGEGYIAGISQSGIDLTNVEKIGISIKEVDPSVSVNLVAVIGSSEIILVKSSTWVRNIIPVPISERTGNNTLTIRYASENVLSVLLYVDKIETYDIDQKIIWYEDVQEIIDENVIRLLDIPDPESTKQVPYRSPNIIANRINNGNFEVDTSGWSLSAYGGVITYGMSADSSNYHNAAKAVRIIYDVPEDSGGVYEGLQGVRFTQSGVDLRGVTQISFYGKQLSASTWYMDAQMLITSPFEDNFSNGRTGSETGRMTGDWLKYTVNVPEEYRLDNQTITISSNYTLSASYDDLDIVIDEVEALGESAPVNLYNYIPDIDTYFNSKYSRFRGISSLTPSDPIAGDIWIDTTSGSVPKIHDGTSWIALT